ncbi:C39 family peptidase [Candidatus Woesearchaeota archaeon]|nr:C39 family peptidase [Candidatus Woesearchaeota archaeon]MCF7901614.1 C39 family peptidase [Candidatus Woesearchaeota archaeon]MCF8014073.1 C39 family peptidase [Candidatus Woesearchaeota archaeon]
MSIRINFNIKNQPDDSSCGPTCLHSIYSYYGEDISLKKVISEVHTLDKGGTLASALGIHALKRGYSATIYTYNIQIFDPSWFLKNQNSLFLINKLKSQLEKKKFDSKKLYASKLAIEFLKLGGQFKYEDLNINLFKKYLKKDVPIIAGVSATYLYNSMRELESDAEYDDILGKPSGHFVVIKGYDAIKKRAFLSDPLDNNPLHKKNNYSVSISKLISSIMLGILTHDANILIIEKKKKGKVI